MGQGETCVGNGSTGRAATHSGVTAANDLDVDCTPPPRTTATAGNASQSIVNVADASKQGKAPANGTAMVET